MNRTPRNLEARDQFERQWLIQNTWCDQCNAVDLGIDQPSEYEEDGRIFVEGVCRVCGKTIRSEIVETDRLIGVHANERLVAEIQDQLNDDILHFGRMVQISRIQDPELPESDHIRAVVDAVSQLHGQGQIVVGNARDVNGVVLIDPWTEKGQNLRLRLVSAIEESDDNDREFCFWIQLAAHFAR